jgi:protein-S-isoprenylcysteine O-methyltransferase Ste14
MGQQALSRIVLWGLIVLFLLVRAFFTIRLREKHDRGPGPINGNSREGKANFIVRRFVLVPALSVFLFLYSLNPSWMTSLSFPLPQWAIWLVAILGLCGIAFLMWVHVCLGNEWTAKLQLRKDHRLVQSGPYSKIRHPMYTALFAIYFSIGIVSSNYIILILLTTAILSIALRIPKEEELLIERFGEEYRTYKQKTGSLFPKL